MNFKFFLLKLKNHAKNELKTPLLLDQKEYFVQENFQNVYFEDLTIHTRVQSSNFIALENVEISFAALRQFAFLIGCYLWQHILCFPAPLHIRHIPY